MAVEACAKVVAAMDSAVVQLFGLMVLGIPVACKRGRVNTRVRMLFSGNQRIPPMMRRG